MSGFRLAVLASGTGTNLQAILDRFHAPARGAEASADAPVVSGIEVAAVASNKPDAQALERAAAAGIETAVFERSDHPDREARDAALADWLGERGLNLVVLAGYMELLSPAFVRRFPNQIINVHPALLPAFPGIDAIEQALKHGAKVTGVTVHFVDEGVDSGPIILQRAIDVPYTRDVADVEQLVHPVEHELLPRAIQLIAAGAVQIDEQNPRLVRIDERQSV